MAHVEQEKENLQQALHKVQPMQWQGSQVLQRDPVAIGLVQTDSRFSPELPIMK